MTQRNISKFGAAFISYGSYHNNVVNKYIHIVFVPTIALTLMTMLNLIPYQLEIYGQNVGFGVIATFLVICYYTSINVLFAIGMSLLSLLLGLSWGKFTEGFDNQALLKWSLIVHIGSWIMQFIGHGVFQKRKPALLDNLTQILIAPLFVVVEIFDIFGIRSDEMKIWQVQIQKNIAEFKKNKSV